MVYYVLKIVHRKVDPKLNKSKKKPWLFRFIKYLVQLFYPKMEVVGLENLPDEPCVIIGNHTQLHGPIACELYFPDNFYTWCAAPMMKLKEVPAYAYKDFWSQKPKYIRPFFKIASYVIAPLSVLIFNNARTIAVYRDNRILTTFRESIAKLQDGKNVIIFPEQTDTYWQVEVAVPIGALDTGRQFEMWPQINNILDDSGIVSNRNRTFFLYLR